MERIKRYSSVVVAVVILLLMSFCSTKKTAKLAKSPGVFVDSMLFFYDFPDYAYETPAQRPYLVSSCTYFYNDSMSNIFDRFDVDELQELGLPERGFYDPLPCRRVADTLFVSLLYSSQRGYYSFGKMNLRHDTILLRFAGTATMSSHRLVPTAREFSPYVLTVFKIKVDSAGPYKVYFRMSDVDV